MNEHEEIQLTLDVGGDEPEGASFRMTGGMRLAEELRMGTPLAVRVIGADGELLAEGDGEVTSVSFRRHPETTARPAWTERIHGVTLS
ncbi:MAG TPA: hypothetical protein VH834_18110 [Solirubrobacteraceae bacterium]